jgi:hypothetical protein
VSEILMCFSRRRKEEKEGRGGSVAPTFFLPPPRGMGLALLNTPRYAHSQLIMASQSLLETNPSTRKTGGSSRTTFTVRVTGSGGGGRWPGRQSRSPPEGLRRVCQSGLRA